MQLRRYIYTNEREQDYDYVRLARKTPRLTYDRRFLNPGINPYQGLRTPFREIRFTKPHEVIKSKWYHLLRTQDPVEVKFEEYMLMLKNALKRYFKEIWDTKKNYLMFHSSGYDSRIISGALAECRDEGLRCDNVHFRCHPPECGIFEQIMKAEGWKPSQYSCFSHSPENFYTIGTDASVNGWASFVQQMNFWEDLGTDWIVIHGWCGEMFRFYIRYRHPKAVHCNNRLLNSTIHRMIGREWEGQWKGIFNDVLSPYFSYYYLDVAMRAKKEWVYLDKKDWHIDSIRTNLIKYFKYPLDKIPRAERVYEWGLTDEHKKDMLRRYYASRFYRDHGKYARRLNLFGKGMYMWDGRTWGFMNVYEKICE